jgi:hypothetical protein
MSEKKVPILLRRFASLHLALGWWPVDTSFSEATGAVHGLAGDGTASFGQQQFKCR